MILFSVLMDQPVNKTHKENVDYLLRLRFRGIAKHPTVIYE